MAYPGVSVRDFASQPPQQVQQGTQARYQAQPNQFSEPQFPLPAPNSRPASYSAPPQVQGPPPTFSVNIADSYPTVVPSMNQWLTNGYPMQPPLQSSFQPLSQPPLQFPLQLPLQFPLQNPLQLPAQFPQIPFPQGGPSATANGGFENFQRTAPHQNESAQSDLVPIVPPHARSQQELPIRSLQQSGDSFRYEDLPANINLMTIHPTLGPCALIPFGALRPPQSPSNWTAASTAGSRHSSRHNDYYRVDHLRRRHSRSREFTPYLRHMSPSPSTLSPYLSSPRSSVTPTPILRRRRLNTAEHRRSSSRFRGIGGFTPLHEYDVPRHSIERSVSLASSIRTCSQCAGTGTESSYEPFTDGSVVPTPRIGRPDADMGQGESSRGQIEGQGGLEESPAEVSSRFQASVEDLDE